MKLQRLKLLSPFRGLKKDFTLQFQKLEAVNSIEPICFVGLNGSGKSNVLECLCEIFYYLESYVNYPQEFNSKKNTDDALFKKEFGFEIEYELDEFGSRQATEFFEVKLTHDKPFQLNLRIIKKPDALPELYAFQEAENFELRDKSQLLKTLGQLLPTRVVGYSSGQNELISNPFFKIDFRYYEQLLAVASETSGQTYSELNRMFYMDYESNKLITICNYLFRFKGVTPNNKLQHINKELKINDLHRFSITLRKPKNIKIAPQLNNEVDNIRKCATSYETLQSGNSEVIRLDFLVNEITRQAFEEYFRSAYELYKIFYSLRLYNVSLYPVAIRKEILQAGLGPNLSAKLPIPADNELIFHINNIEFTKYEVNEPVSYRHLSDGEHQLLHVMGTIILMDSSRSLFLLDEPETHFNPEWRSKFVSLLNKCIGSQEQGALKREQEIIVTTHSPFIVSDCRAGKVLIFEKGKSNSVKVSHPDINTFGSSVNQITSKVFKKKETIAGLATQRLEELNTQFSKKELTKKQIMNELDTLGDSIEKMIFIDEINRKRQ